MNAANHYATPPIFVLRRRLIFLYAFTVTAFTYDGIVVAGPDVLLSTTPTNRSKAAPAVPPKPKGVCPSRQPAGTGRSPCQPSPWQPRAPAEKTPTASADDGVLFARVRALEKVYYFILLYFPPSRLTLRNHTNMSWVREFYDFLNRTIHAILINKARWFFNGFRPGNVQFTPPDATQRDNFVASGRAVWCG